MKASVLTDTRTIEVRDRTRPEPGDCEALVRVGACGVCTTDYHMYSGTFPVDYPLVLGHECAGEVVIVGDGDTALAPGARVAINPSVPCRRCAKCKAGRTNLCANHTSIGGAGDTIIDGAFAEYVRVPAANTEPIGDLSMKAAAFAEPLACCIHGIDQINLTSGDTVAIIGAGPIGLLLVQTLRTSGAGSVVVSEPVDERRELAVALGADHVVDPSETDPERALSARVGDIDVAIEAVGHPATIQQAHEVTAPGGTTLVFGVPPRETTIEIDPFAVYYDELELVGTYSLTPNTFRRAVTLLRNGRVDVAPLVTDEFPLRGLERAFDRMDGAKGLKNIVVPAE